MGFVSKKNFSNKQNEITLNKKTFEPKKVFSDIWHFNIFDNKKSFDFLKDEMKWNSILEMETFSSVRRYKWANTWSDVWLPVTNIRSQKAVNFKLGSHWSDLVRWLADL